MGKRPDLWPTIGWHPKRVEPPGEVRLNYATRIFWHSRSFSVTRVARQLRSKVYDQSKSTRIGRLPGMGAH